MWKNKNILTIKNDNRPITVERKRSNEKESDCKHFACVLILYICIYAYRLHSGYAR